eukprot:TRINITY_DN12784_c0_g1_i1.p2 TRINITY_DN12784_c0_g1~~TRINITY_DN12784_c0_g1_i1.p2  ORF type:complete len:60 (-),score=4.18 TRINITY_DN12784_c0_g1_i1:504-683(-)
MAVRSSISSLHNNFLPLSSLPLTSSSLPYGCPKYFEFQIELDLDFWITYTVSKKFELQN